MQGKKSVKYISKHIKLQPPFRPVFDMHRKLSIYVEQTYLGTYNSQVESQSHFPSDLPHLKINLSLLLKRMQCSMSSVCTQINGKTMSMPVSVLNAKHQSW